MTPAAEAASPSSSRAGGNFGRIAALGALAFVLIAVIYLLFFGGGDGHKYKLLFETGGQLVKGNEVLIGGHDAGTVDSIELTDDGQAEVEITVEKELHEGTSAVIRATSLSGIANRYISITPGPNNADKIDEGGFITQADTTTPVDLDQLLNTFREPERKALADIIEGSATVYAGRAEEANETYRYLSPALVATDKLFQELNRDQEVLANFLVSGSRVVTSLAERRDDLAGLVSNGNQFLGAIASQNAELDRVLAALPPALRQSNTTFFNLRATLDDLDGLVETAKPATKNLAPFLRQFKKVAGKSVPVFKNLRLAVNKDGKNNDLADAFAKLPAAESAAARASGPAVNAMNDSIPTLRFIRPYTPDLWGAVTRLGQITAFYDANGHYARVQPAGMSVFHYNPATEILEPIPPSDQFADYCAPAAFPCAPDVSPNFGIYQRCPGGAMQPANDGSSPFVGPVWLGSDLTPGPPFPPGDCQPTDVLPGP
jgi:phospholipid/cholesterol/gamma-HCH transport system substrate-binding protein